MTWQATMRCGLMGVVVGAALVGFGCDSPKAQPKPKPRTVQEQFGIKVPEGPAPASVDEALLSDPCTTRLHDLTGALLMYYALNKTLPNSLGDLASVEGMTGKLNLVCPGSNKAYVYDPQGLHAVGSKMYIVAYDAEPVHGGEGAKKLGGARHVIVTPEVVQGTGRTFEVIILPEGTFKTFNLKQPM